MHRIALVLVAVCLALVAFGGVASQARADINYGNVQLCLNGGWHHLMRSNTTAFQSQFQCQQYAVFGGAIYALASIHLDAFYQQGGTNVFRVDGQGDGLEPLSTVSLRVQQNNTPIPVVTFPVDSNGSVSIFWGDLNCEYGTVFSATATGTSADSLSTPTRSGVPIISNTASGTAIYGCGS